MRNTPRVGTNGFDGSTTTIKISRSVSWGSLPLFQSFGISVGVRASIGDSKNI
jgi:hypothetical protein